MKIIGTKFQLKVWDEIKKIPGKKDYPINILHKKLVNH